MCNVYSKALFPAQLAVGKQYRATVKLALALMAQGEDEADTMAYAKRLMAARPHGAAHYKAFAAVLAQHGIATR